jgi:hypothetical protein
MTVNYLMNWLRREKQRQNWTLDRLGSCLLHYAGFRSRPPTSVGRALHPFMTPLMGSRCGTELDATSPISPLLSRRKFVMPLAQRASKNPEP